MTNDTNTKAFLFVLTQDQLACLCAAIEEHVEAGELALETAEETNDQLYIDEVAEELNVTKSVDQILSEVSWNQATD